MPKHVIALGPDDAPSPAGDSTEVVFAMGLALRGVPVQSDEELPGPTEYAWVPTFAGNTLLYPDPLYVQGTYDAGFGLGGPLCSRVEYLVTEGPLAIYLEAPAGPAGGQAFDYMVIVVRPPGTDHEVTIAGDLTTPGGLQPTFAPPPAEAPGIDMLQFRWCGFQGARWLLMQHVGGLQAMPQE